MFFYFFIFSIKDVAEKKKKRNTNSTPAAHKAAIAIGLGLITYFGKIKRNLCGSIAISSDGTLSYYNFTVLLILPETAKCHIGASQSGPKPQGDSSTGKLYLFIFFFLS